MDDPGEIAIRADLEALDIERTHLTDKLNSRELELKSAQSAATARRTVDFGDFLPSRADNW